jgi:hypothetical protein
MRLEDGFPTLVSFSIAPAIFTGDLWIKRITPPGYDGGGPIPDTSMHNNTMRTQYPKYLISVTDATLIVSFDPDAYGSVFIIINVNQLLTYLFPLGETLAIPGWVNTFIPSEFSEGNQPEATMQLIHSNQVLDEDELVEASPEYTDV